MQRQPSYFGYPKLHPLFSIFRNRNSSRKGRGTNQKKKDLGPVSKSTWTENYSHLNKLEYSAPFCFCEHAALALHAKMMKGPALTQTRLFTLAAPLMTTSVSLDLTVLHYLRRMPRFALIDCSIDVSLHLPSC